MDVFKKKRKKKKAMKHISSGNPVLQIRIRFIAADLLYETDPGKAKNAHKNRSRESL